MDIWNFLFLIVKEILGLLLLIGFLVILYGVFASIAYFVSILHQIYSNEKIIISVLKRKYPHIYKKLIEHNRNNPFQHIYGRFIFNEIINRFITVIKFKGFKKNIDNSFNEMYQYNLIIQTKDEKLISLVNNLKKSIAKEINYYFYFIALIFGLSLIIFLIYTMGLIIVHLI